MKKLRKKQIMLFSILLALSLPANLFAQRGGGLLGGDQTGGVVKKGFLERGPVSYTVQDDNTDLIGNQPFGVQPTDYTPLGSGVFMLVVAGVGYAMVKSRK